MQVELPAPSDAEMRRSLQCQQLITNEINVNQHPISFERYMQMCLYSEEVGYYESGGEIFGAQGDFTTSPERSNFFAAAFAAHIKNIQEDLGEFSIIEVGAGSGKFAGELIQALRELQCIPRKYYIVEKSTALRERQKIRLRNELNKCDIQWLEEITKPIECAVVIANEVLDALPVKLVSVKNNNILERCVGLNDSSELEFVERCAEEDLSTLIRDRVPESILQQTGNTYHTDVNLLLNDFIKKIASFVDKGIFFYVDYGYPRSEYYHEQRAMGTLICHYKHIANEQALLWPGLQDISCNVDFTALAEAGEQNGLSVTCYSTQAHFLLASNLLETWQTKNLDAMTLSDQAQIKRLMMPAEMGERFQVMVLAKNMQLLASQFTTRDLLHRL